MRLNLVFVIVYNADPISTYSHTCAAAELIPHSTEGESLILLGKCEHMSKISLILTLAKLVVRSEKSLKKSLLNVSHTDNPSGDTVDGCIKVIKRDEHTVKGAASDDLLGDLAGLVVVCHHVVGVPAHAAGYVKRDLIIEGK